MSKSKAESEWGRRGVIEAKACKGVYFIGRWMEGVLNIKSDSAKVGWEILRSLLAGDNFFMR